MEQPSIDKRSGSATSRRVVSALASVVAIAAIAIGVGSASAQSGGTTTPTETTPAPPPPTTGAYPPGTALFPVPSEHNFGGAGSRFGAGRGGRRHQGQDVFAPCGQPAVAVGYNRVIATGFQRAAGHYVVLRYKRYKQDYMYAHLTGPALVRKKARVTPGQLIGYVGQTGNARGCHLHFEIWSGKWYRGGTPVDPLPSLTSWDSYS